MGQISSAPVELIRVQRGGGKEWRGAVAEMQGWRADHEDAHFMRNSVGSGTAEQGYSIFGVLDGHGGCEVARLAAHERLPEALQRAADGAGEDATSDALEEAVSAAFVETDAWLRERPEVTRDQSGSTCVVAGVRRARTSTDAQGTPRYEVFIANAGDSRGLALRTRRGSAGSPGASAGDQVEVAVASEDHKPDRRDEHARIAAAGGFVSDADAAKRGGAGLANVVARLDGNLAVSRGLGDFAYKRDARREPAEQKVSCVPELYRLARDEGLAPGDLVVLACDGIFDVMTNEALARTVALQVAAGVDVGDLAANVVSTCLRDLNSKDNMTLMIIQVGVDGSDYAYRPPKKSPSSALSVGLADDLGPDAGALTGSTADDLDADDAAPTVEAGDLDEDDEDDDDDDDKTVDEIVGIDQYDRQCDESVKRSYITFLEYCESDDSRKLPREARNLLARVGKEDQRSISAARNAVIARNRFGLPPDDDDDDDDDDDEGPDAARH